MTSSLVVDASVALKWVIKEEHHDCAGTLLPLASRLTAPDIMLAECANVCRKKVKRGEMIASQATVGLDTIWQVIPSFEPIAPLSKRALGLAIDLDHHAYDCVYLALAESNGGILVTADRVLVRKIDRAGTKIGVIFIGDSSLAERLAAG